MLANLTTLDPIEVKVWPFALLWRRDVGAESAEVGSVSTRWVSLIHGS
jgi:hypothetical protein